MVNCKSITLGIFIIAASTVAAAPAASEEKRNNICIPLPPFKSYTAQYDDLTFTDYPATPIGTYQGLTYSNFYVDQYDGFIQAASGTQYAMSYDCTKPRVISVSKTGDFFNLQSFFLACNSGYPQDACYVTVKGTYLTGQTITRDIVYPALDNTKPFVMKEFDFDVKWSALKSLEFQGGNIDGVCIYTGVMVDNLKYTKPTCKNV